VLLLDPTRRFAWIGVGAAHEQQHRYPEAIAEFQHASALLGMPVDGLAHAYAIAGQIDAARRILREIETTSPGKPGGLDWFYIAGVYAALGDKDKAFAWLEQAYENRDFNLTYLKVHPYFDALRSDPRLKAFYTKINLPD
jgi:tetratricopeptide (TPR) repeat protein